MTIFTAFRRLLATATGAGILAASANAVITASHQDTAHATVTWALAAGIFVGSAVYGHILSVGRTGLAVAMLATLLAGEAANTILSGDRIVAEREATQASVKASSRAHIYARDALAEASEAYHTANKASVTEAAKSGCRVECAKLLAAQVANAQADLDHAQRRYDANPAPEVSGSPLADRLGVPAYVIDLVLAVLIALGANGLAATLIAYGCHAERSTSTAISVPNGSPGQQTRAPNGSANGSERFGGSSRPARQPNGSGQRSSKGSGQGSGPNDPRLALERFVTTQVALGRTIGAQRDLVERFGLAPSTVSDTLADMEGRGLIRRRMDGRRKVTEAT